jgi:crotonobetainyl-CoA:carnitine CoA-transferase CaiB-like acyl-CoA transferase
VEAWAAGLTRAEIFALTQRYKVPSAPVRDLDEVMANAHMRGRGMLEDIDHPSLGRITVPGSPLRYQGAPPIPATPSRALGEDNAEVWGDFGLAPEDVARLKADGVI